MTLLEGIAAHGICFAVIVRDTLDQRLLAAHGVDCARVIGFGANHQHRAGLAAGQHAGGAINELLRHLAAYAGDFHVTRAQP